MGCSTTKLKNPISGTNIIQLAYNANMLTGILLITTNPIPNYS